MIEREAAVDMVDGHDRPGEAAVLDRLVGAALAFEAERVRLCAIMNKDTERYERDCTRPGDPVR